MSLPLAPFYVLALVLIGINCTLFYIVFGGKRFALWTITGAVAFLLGHAATKRFLGHGMIILGDLNPIEASLTAWIAMVLVRYLAK